MGGTACAIASINETQGGVRANGPFLFVEIPSECSVSRALLQLLDWLSGRGVAGCPRGSPSCMGPQQSTMPPMHGPHPSWRRMHSGGIQSGVVKTSLGPGPAGPGLRVKRHPASAARQASTQ